MVSSMSLMGSPWTTPVAVCGRHIQSSRSGIYQQWTDDRQRNLTSDDNPLAPYDVAVGNSLGSFDIATPDGVQTNDGHKLGLGLGNGSGQLDNPLGSYLTAMVICM